MKPRALVVIALTTLLATAACNPIYYSPSTQNVPLLARDGALAGTLAVGEARFEAQGAYALTSAIGVQLNAGKYEPDDLDNGDGGSGSPRVSAAAALQAEQTCID